jgi:hypothetical protein
MPNIKCWHNEKYICFNIDGGGEGSQYLPAYFTPEQLTYYSIIFGLSEFFNKWNKELDARAYDGEEKTSSPAVFTKRELPPPINVILKDVLVYEELSNQRSINPLHEKYIKNIRNMSNNLKVKFSLEV